MTMTQAAALHTRAATIGAAAARLVTTRRAAVGHAERELSLAATWHLRRASEHGSVDNLIYRHGSAEQCLGGLALNPIALLGLKAAGAIAYPWLIAAAERNPTGSFVDHARAVLADPKRYAWCVELGAFHRFQWKARVYSDAVDAWQAKVAANDKKAAWRRRTITARQRYLVELIVECLSAANPAVRHPHLANRGEAHDWLRAQGGNPTFWHPPSRPAPLGEVEIE